MSSTHQTLEDEATLRHDIQRTLTNLQDLITGQLQPASEKVGQKGTLLVKRYREILFDLSGDFEKARQAHVRKQERAKLMEGAKPNLNGGSDDPGMDHLLRERNHIGNSLNAVSSVIGQANEVHADLRTQGMSLGKVQGMMSNIASNIPGINTIVEKIRRKKSKDDKIVAGVIASCILFTVWYLFH